MNHCLLNTIFYFLILINILFYSNCTISKDDCINQCFKKIIYRNGTVNSLCVDDEKSVKEEIITSFKNEDSFIIYDCAKKENYGECQNNIQEDSVSGQPSASSCIKKKTKNDDNICCYYMERQENESVVNYSCIEINKYEIDNFNSIAFNLDNNANGIVKIECYNKIYKIKKFFILVLFLIYF